MTNDDVPYELTETETGYELIVDDPAHDTDAALEELFYHGFEDEDPDGEGVYVALTEGGEAYAVAYVSDDERRIAVDGTPPTEPLQDDLARVLHGEEVDTPVESYLAQEQRERDEYDDEPAGDFELADRETMEQYGNNFTGGIPE